MMSNSSNQEERNREIKKCWIIIFFIILAILRGVSDKNAMNYINIISFGVAVHTLLNSIIEKGNKKFVNSEKKEKVNKIINKFIFLNGIICMMILLCEFYYAILNVKLSDIISILALGISISYLKITQIIVDILDKDKN